MLLLIDSLTNIVQEDLNVLDSENFSNMMSTGFGRSYSPVYQVTVGPILIAQWHMPETIT